MGRDADTPFLAIQSQPAAGAVGTPYTADPLVYTACKASRYIVQTSMLMGMMWACCSGNPFVCTPGVLGTVICCALSQSNDSRTIKCSGQGRDSVFFASTEGHDACCAACRCQTSPHCVSTLSGTTLLQPLLRMLLESPVQKTVRLQHERECVVLPWLHSYCCFVCARNGEIRICTWKLVDENCQEIGNLWCYNALGHRYPNLTWPRLVCVCRLPRDLTTAVK